MREPRLYQVPDQHGSTDVMDLKRELLVAIEVAVRGLMRTTDVEEHQIRVGAINACAYALSVLA